MKKNHLDGFSGLNLPCILQSAISQSRIGDSYGFIILFYWFMAGPRSKTVLSHKTKCRYHHEEYNENILCLTFAATACSDADLAEAAEGKWINTCQLKDDEGTPYTQSTLYSFTHIDSNTKEGGCVAIHDAPSFLFITI